MKKYLPTINCCRKNVEIFSSQRKITYLTGFLTTKAVVVGGSIA